MTDINAKDLPFRYFSPKSEGKVLWVCDMNEDKKLTSVFFNSDTKEKVITNVTGKEALYIKDELVKDGWLVAPPIKVTFTYDGKEVKRK